jgi:GT2 family glycosyltransferase
LNQQLDDRDQKIRLVNINVSILEQEINSMKSSILWKSTTVFDNYIIRQIFPDGTKRKSSYELALKGARIFVNDGWKKFIQDFSAYRQRKKVEKLAIIKSSKQKKTLEIASQDKICEIESDLIFPQITLESEVSIIIPVFNNWNFTFACLKSLASQTHGNYEVIVVDDSSTDITPEMLKKIGNIKIIRNNQNKGFVDSCNRGAEESRSPYLIFLNNDTVVTDYWLDPLLTLIRKHEVGAVGAKLVYPNGLLQEAGGIIWTDGTGWNYGKGENPEKPEYNFVREVDYCSGAALIVKRDLFNRIGGFDTRFKPGYYEDTDLCFSIRSLGYKVLYQPSSVIFHHEGITSGTDPNSGMKKSQEINRIKFLQKWSSELSHFHLKPDSKNLFSARNHTDGKNILVIDHYVPWFDKDAGSQRMYQILKILRDLGNNVTFAGENLVKYEPYTSILQQAGVEIVYAPHFTSIETYLIEFGQFFEIVLVSRAHIAIKHIGLIKKYCPNAKVIFDTVDLQHLRIIRQAEIERNSNLVIEANQIKKMELNLARICDSTWVVSPVEQTMLRNEDSSIRVDLVSDIQEICENIIPFHERKDILFIGGFVHPPNVDAIRWFVKDVFPKIKKHLPEVKLRIIGSDPTAEIYDMANEDIFVMGFVEKIEPYLEGSRIFIAPVRYGAGIKGKINKSMCYGLPVVTTSVGAEGMYLIDRKNALINDDAEIFANNCIELYQDEQLWKRLSENSLTNINDHFSYIFWKNKIHDILNEFFHKQ